MKVKLTHPFAKAPFRANPTDAGADLFSPMNCIVPRNDYLFMDFGVQIELPKNTVGLIFARSGIGTKQGIVPRNCVGVIDEKYRGNLGMMIKNDGDKDFQIYTHDRIAQLVVVPVEYVGFEVVDELDMNDDRKGGFGHTGN